MKKPNFVYFIYFFNPIFCEKLPGISRATSSSEKKLTKIQQRCVIYNLVFYRLMGQQFLRVQSRILFAVYVPAAAPAFARISSEVLSTMILLPRFLIGYLYWLFINLILGKKPDFFDRMVKFLGASDSCDIWWR